MAKIWPGASFSKVPKRFGPISGATILFISYLRNPGVVGHQLRNPLVFCDIKNMLRDQLFKTSGLQFENWIFGPEKFSGLSRNRPLSSMNPYTF